jgi:hypothetical protein
MELGSLIAARMGYRVKGRRAQPKICGETFGVMEVEYRFHIARFWIHLCCHTIIISDALYYVL